MKLCIGNVLHVQVHPHDTEYAYFSRGAILSRCGQRQFQHGRFRPSQGSAAIHLFPTPLRGVMRTCSSDSAIYEHPLATLCHLTGESVCDHSGCVLDPAVKWVAWGWGGRSRTVQTISMQIRSSYLNGSFLDGDHLDGHRRPRAGLDLEFGHVYLLPCIKATAPSTAPRRKWTPIVPNTTES